MNSVIEEIYKTQRVDDGGGNLINPFPGAISYEDGLTLYHVIRDSGPHNTMEIGLAYGLSTLFICQAHRDNGGGCHTAIDPHERTKWKSIGLLNISRAGLDNILKFYEARSEAILPQLVSSGERFDFVFIDGNHRFDYALLDFFYVDKLLSTDGLIMFDDLWMPAIRKLCAFILRNRNYELAAQEISVPKSQRKRLFRFARSVLQTPFDSCALRLSAYFFAWGLSDYCLIRKVSDDDRKWDHFKSF